MDGAGIGGDWETAHDAFKEDYKKNANCNSWKPGEVHSYRWIDGSTYEGEWLNGKFEELRARNSECFA